MSGFSIRKLLPTAFDICKYCTRIGQGVRNKVVLQLRLSYKTIQINKFVYVTETTKRQGERFQEFSINNYNLSLMLIFNQESCIKSCQTWDEIEHKVLIVNFMIEFFYIKPFSELRVILFFRYGWWMFSTNGTAGNTEDITRYRVTIDCSQRWTNEWNRITNILMSSIPLTTTSCLLRAEMWTQGNGVCVCMSYKVTVNILHWFFLVNLL